MEKLFLLDAYALIYRAYYAFIKNPRINSKGLNTSAILGFCNTLHEVIEKEKPTHLGVAFDPHGPTFRSEAFPEYKAQREATPEDIRASVPIIKDILTAMNIPILQSDGFEADDVIGTLALKSGEMGVSTYMLTPDKDYGQLVRDNVFIYRPRHGGGYEVMDPAAVCQKYGIASPLQVIDLLALMGDSADNFPGCPGVGEKTAVKLINEFGSVEQLLERTDELKGALKRKVESAVDDIRMSKFLATIRTDVPVELNLDSLKMVEPNEAELRKLFNELEFRSLSDKFLKNQKKSEKKVDLQQDLFGFFTTETTEAEKISPKSQLNSVNFEYQLIENEEEAQHICDFLLTKKILSLDTETTSTNPIEAELVGLSFAVEPHKAFYVAIPEDQEKAQRFVNIFKPLYENPEILKIGQNIKYDLEVLANYGVTLAGDMWDTMIAHYLIQPELRHNIDYMAETLLNYQKIHTEDLIGKKGKNQLSMRELSPNQVYKYACEDADITLQLKYVLEPLLEERKCKELFYNIEMPLINVLAEMEMNGVIIDRESLKETSSLFNKRLEKIENEIYELAGEKFNITSPKQVGDVLFDKLRIIDNPKKTRSWQYVTNEKELESIKDRHEIIGKILEYRKLNGILSNKTKNKQIETTHLDLFDTTFNGDNIDSKIEKMNHLDISKQMKILEKDIYTLAGEKFKIMSPKQVGKILFEKLRIVDNPKKTETWQYVTNEEILQQLKGKHRIVELILAYRETEKLVGTYVDSLPSLINKKTGHIHTTFNQTITATGRLSSSEPNLQNIPVRGEDGKEIRKAFIPEPGCLFFSADYSQIELRVMAHLSEDENMMRVFREGHDLHAATAATIYKKDINEVTRDERTKSKRANFGIIYGITVFGLAERLEIERAEAKQLIDGFFETFPQVHDYMERSKEKARELGYAETIFHRRRYLPDINSQNAVVRNFAERNAINAPIQGSAADIIKVAMIRIYKRFKDLNLKSKMILQVHDELNFNVVPEEKETVEKIVLEEMQNAYQLRVPLIADCGWGENWLEAH